MALSGKDYCTFPDLFPPTAYSAFSLLARSKIFTDRFIGLKLFCYSDISDVWQHVLEIHDLATIIAFNKKEQVPFFFFFLLFALF